MRVYEYQVDLREARVVVRCKHVVAELFWFPCAPDMPARNHNIPVENISLPHLQSEVQTYTIWGLSPQRSGYIRTIEKRLDFDSCFANERSNVAYTKLRRLKNFLL